MPSAEQYINPLKEKINLIIFNNGIRTTDSTLNLHHTTNPLKMYREIITVYSVNHTEHKHTLQGQNVEFLNVKPGGT
jgi:hypothetical protein